jgi:hypothetical protein
MRHVGNILVYAIATGGNIDWEVVHSKRGLKGTSSILSDAQTLQWETILTVPTSKPTTDGHGPQHANVKDEIEWLLISLLHECS